MMDTWQAQVTAKRRDALARIPEEWRLLGSFLQCVGASENEPTDLVTSNAVQRSGLLSSTELDITENYTASELVEKLALGSISSETVTRAFSKRAAIAQQLVRVSCLVC
jgi:amidase